VQATGEVGGEYMSKKTSREDNNFLDDGYSDAPPEIEAAIRNSIPIEDFLPTPAELAQRSEKQRISIMLDVDVLGFFRQAAKENGVKYQTMINTLLRDYMESMSKQA